MIKLSIEVKFLKNRWTTKQTNRKTPLRTSSGESRQWEDLAVGMAAPLIESRALTLPTLPKSISFFFFFFKIHSQTKPWIWSNHKPHEGKVGGLTFLYHPVSAIHRTEFITSAQWMFIIQIGMHTHLCWVHKWIWKPTGINSSNKNPKTSGSYTEGN